MPVFKSKCWYSNNCLHFLKCAVEQQINMVKYDADQEIMITYENLQIV
jgi:hypothetical protein